MSVEELRTLIDGATTEDGRQRLKDYLQRKAEREPKPLPIALAEANERMDRGESVDFDTLKELLEKLERLGL